MIKAKIIYGCKECGGVSQKWQGQCPDCKEWNTLTEIVQKDAKHLVQQSSNFSNYAGDNASKISNFNEITLEAELRVKTDLEELNRVLGGGLVSGSVILIGGDPGIGKSTILLQTLAQLSKSHKALYVTGEESLQQVKIRATRLSLERSPLGLLTETNIEKIIELCLEENPKFLVLDSIQTMHTNIVQSAPGSVAQVRECCAHLVKYAKQKNVTIFLIGHVTKEGAIAGPRILEHMVDTVLYFEGDPDNKYRIIRAYKNRFGAVNELGIFAMTDTGLKGVNNPSAIFLSRTEVQKPGSVVMVTKEGTRPMLVEIQALVDESHLANPRRITVGFDQNRISMVLAIMHRHAGVATYNMDIFVNVVGGVRINETAVDLPAFVAIFSSLKNKPVPVDLVFFGEIGLAGEIRPVQNGQERLKESVKLGFKRAVIPFANVPKTKLKGMEIFPVKNVSEVVKILGDI